jgi:hypothetical protein
MKERKAEPDLNLKINQHQEGEPLDQGVQEIFNLISSGFLPPADTVLKDGQPAWGFNTLAKIIGCEVAELSLLLKRQGARFKPDALRH